VKQQKLNLVLLGAAAALGATIYLTREKEPPKNPPLTALKADQLSHVVLSHPQAPDIVLDKKDGRWMLSAPVQTPADPFEINTLLGLASAEVRSSLDPKDVKPKDLGLDPPGISLTLNQQKLEFGGVQPYNFQRYVQTGGKVDLIDDPPATALDTDYSELVDKALLPEGAPIASVQVPGLKVVRSPDDKTWIAIPADPRAGSDELQKFIDAWSHARALWNTALPAARPAAAPPAAVVTLKNGQSYSFDILGRDPQLVLGRTDLRVQYSLSKADADILLKLPEPPPPATPQPVPALPGQAGGPVPPAPLGPLAPPAPATPPPTAH
jgi:hypothetical protein